MAVQPREYQGHNGWRAHRSSAHSAGAPNPAGTAGQPLPHWVLTWGGCVGYRAGASGGSISTASATAFVGDLSRNPMDETL